MPARPQCLDLVAHQRLQRRDDDRQILARRGRGSSNRATCPRRWASRRAHHAPRAPHRPRSAGPAGTTGSRTARAGGLGRRPRRESRWRGRRHPCRMGADAAAGSRVGLDLDGDGRQRTLTLSLSLSLSAMARARASLKPFSPKKAMNAPRPASAPSRRTSRRSVRARTPTPPRPAPPSRAACPITRDWPPTTASLSAAIFGRCPSRHRFVKSLQWLLATLAPTVPSTAMPSAPPTWREAFTTPEAMPALSGETEPIAVDAVVGIVIAMPMPIAT